MRHERAEYYRSGMPEWYGRLLDAINAAYRIAHYNSCSCEACHEVKRILDDAARVRRDADS